jgi:hypothetical protein
LRAREPERVRVPGELPGELREPEPLRQSVAP